MYIYVTGSGKIGIIATATDIHFLPVHESYTHALPRNTNRWPGLLLQTAFYRCCQTIMVHFIALGSINKTAWDTKLLSTAVSTSFVDSTSLCHILKAWHCSLSANGCFNLPTAPHPPTPTAHPTPLPPPIDSIHDITGTEENCPKTK